MMYLVFYTYLFFFFNDPTTSKIYTLSLHDALPICSGSTQGERQSPTDEAASGGAAGPRSHLAISEHHAVVALGDSDRKSTRLNSSHSQISYAVFCLKKKKK